MRPESIIRLLLCYEIKIAHLHTDLTREVHQRCIDELFLHVLDVGILKRATYQSLQ